MSNAVSERKKIDDEIIDEIIDAITDETDKDPIESELRKNELKCKIDNSQNNNDINKYLESIICDLFKLIYDGEFENLNEIRYNFPAVDVINKKEKKIIQVTSAKPDVTKINSTLKRINKANKILSDKIAEYSEENYTLEFLFFTHIDSTYKSKFIKDIKENICYNSSKIRFNPDKNIRFLNNLISDIRDLKPEQRIKILNLLKLNRDNKIHSLRISTLSEILLIMSETNLSTELDNDLDLKEFKIEAKIQFNNLEKIKQSVINENMVYFGHIQKIYQQFDQQGHNKKFVIFRKLKRFYDEQKENLEINSIERFQNIIESVKNLVRNSANYPNLSEEELESYSEMIVVHAFIECKIFEKPKERK